MHEKIKEHILSHPDLSEESKKIFQEYFNEIEKWHREWFVTQKEFRDVTRSFQDEVNRLNEKFDALEEQRIKIDRKLFQKR